MPHIAVGMSLIVGGVRFVMTNVVLESVPTSPAARTTARYLPAAAGA
jgi:hypothetical protein